MEIDLENALKFTQFILKYSIFVEDFGEYARTYFSPTENIASYLTQVSFHRDKVLTVAGGGDQIFNLVNLNVFNIDAFDINILTYFTFYLKYAFIMGLSYEEFMSYSKERFYVNYLTDFEELLEKVKDNLPEMVYSYFKRIIKFQYSEFPLRGMVPLFKSTAFYHDEYNLYAKNKKEYEKTRCNLHELNLHFYFWDVKEIPSKLNSKYDLILLSNIADYLGKSNKKGFVNKEEFEYYINTFYRLLENDGVLINYLFHYNHDFIVGNSNIKKEDLDEYEFYQVSKKEGFLIRRRTTD